MTEAKKRNSEFETAANNRKSNVGNKGDIFA